LVKADTHPPPRLASDQAGCEFYERTDEGGSEGEGSKRNENEAELVRKHVEKLVSRDSRMHAIVPASH
jgi:hypothetical protein